jgi:hypothetical protein
VAIKDVRPQEKSSASQRQIKPHTRFSARTFVIVPASNVYRAGASALA